MDVDLLEESLQANFLNTVTYAELRFHSRKTLAMLIKDSQLETLHQGMVQGVGTRVLADGAWGFSATSTLTRKAIEGSLHDAMVLAQKSAPYLKDKIQLASVKPITGEFIVPHKIHLETIAIEEKLNAMKKAVDLFSKKEIPNLQSYSFGYAEFIDEKIIVTSEGTQVRIFDQKPNLGAFCILAEGNEKSTGFDGHSISGGWEIMDNWSMCTVVQNAINQAQRLLHRPTVKGGKQRVILDSKVGGLLAHEAIGHTAEADLVKGGSFLAEKIGEQISSPLVTLIDVPEIGQGAGWLPVDDEGIKARKAIIIKNGVLKEYMTDRQHAFEFGIEPTGNARANTFIDSPIIRMRNTCFEVGDYSFEELVEELGNGYYIKEAEGGQADFNGEMMFSTREAYVIKNGELTDQVLKSAVISGNAFNLLNSISAMGKDFVLDLGYGRCAKMQAAKVDAGSPSMICEVVLGGQ